MGYQGEARYVAFYWQPAGDEAMYNDGRMAGDGDWWAWLGYVDHPTVAPHLMRPCQTCSGRGTADTLYNNPCLDCDGAGRHLLNLGSSDFEADHWLILDREEREVYAAAVPAAVQFLAAQWPPQPDISAEDAGTIAQALQEALDEFQSNWQPPSDEELTAQIMAAKEICADMTDWLNGQVV
jgi:hypothetical protein